MWYLGRKYGVRGEDCEIVVSISSSRSAVCRQHTLIISPASQLHGDDLAFFSDRREAIPVLGRWRAWFVDDKS